MKIVLTAIGTMGYAQPLFALSTALRGAGHETLLVLPTLFERHAARLGLPFISTGAGLDEATMRGTLTSQIASESAQSSMNHFLDITLPMLPDLYAELKSVCDGADLLISTPFHLAGRMVHEACGIPFVTLHLMPMGISRAGPSRASTAPQINAWRARLGFPELPDPLGSDSASPQLALHAVSRLVLQPGPQWPAHHHVTGFLFLDEPYTPDPELQAFLEAGDPPVVVSFGSMAHDDPAAVTELLVTAVRRAGRRAIIQRGWSGLTTSLAGEDVHFIDYVPYGRLFPDAACVVHHGGAGTTAATLRAGVPSVFVPHLHDQPIWAQLLYSIGCTAGIVPYDKLTVDRLSAAIARTVTSPRCHRAAQAVSQKIEAEHGNATAVEHIETLGRTAKAGFTP